MDEPRGSGHRLKQEELRLMKRAALGYGERWN